MTILSIVFDDMAIIKKKGLTKNRVMI